MRVVITGATGAVGRALIKTLCGMGSEILVLGRPGSPRNAGLSEINGVELAECELADIKNFCREKADRYDCFFHLGWGGTTGDARNDMHLQNKNVEYTLDAVDLASRLGCKVFVGTGSQAEYGRVEGKLSSSTPAFPENGYGMAKLCAGQMSRIKCQQLGIKHVWARILSVYGEYDTENSMVMATVNKLLSEIVPEFTAGEQIWDYMYSEDAAKALVAIAQKGRDGAVYCLGSGRPAQLREYIEMIRDAVDPTASLGIGKVPYAKNQVMYLCADITELTRDTGFVPEYSFEEGIARTVEWARSRYAALV